VKKKEISKKGSRKEARYREKKPIYK